MRVLYIADKIDKYGSIDSMIQMIDSLVENNNIEPVIIMSKEGRLSEWAKCKGYDYYCLNYKSFFVHISDWYLKIFKSKLIRKLYGYYYLYFENKCLSEISRIMDLSEIDIIHTNINRVGLGAAIAKKYNIPHIWHVREMSSESHYDLVPIFDDYVDRFNEATKIIFISNTVNEFWIKKGFSSKNAIVIPDGITHKTDFVNRDILCGNIYKFVMAGYICNNKGQDQLLNAVSMLPENLNNNIFIDFYGDYEKKYFKYLNELIKIKHIKNVRFMGYVEDVQNRFVDYDFGIVCSNVEGLGRATVNYICTG